MKTNYIVNYGVRPSSLVETERFETYKSAKEFFCTLDRSKYKAGNIVKLIPDGIYVLTVIKDQY